MAKRHPKRTVRHSHGIADPAHPTSQITIYGWRITPKEAAEVLGIGRSKLYELLQAGSIE